MPEKNKLMNNIETLRKNLHASYFEYDTDKYPFKLAIEKSLGSNLEDIHNILGKFDVFSRKKDQLTLAHKVFYANYNRDLKEIYENFVKNFIAQIIPGDFYYQMVPTFRIGLPGNRFVGEYHTDRKYNHESHEINFNLGLANYVGDNSLRIEKSPNSGEYIKLECKYGNIFSFDHLDCMHGAEINNTNSTMASIDFRISLVDLYKDTNANSINLGMPLKPGKYFSSIAIKSKCN